MTKYARNNMLRGIMKQAWSISERIGVDIGNALKVSWGTMWYKTPINHTKIVGVTFEGRQSILKQVLDMNAWFTVSLKREFTNIHDQNAIAAYIVLPKGKAFKVGYINKLRASVLAVDMDAGKSVFVIKSEIIGSEYLNDGGYLGMSISYVVI